MRFERVTSAVLGWQIAGRVFMLGKQARDKVRLVEEVVDVGCEIYRSRVVIVVLRLGSFDVL